MAANVNKGFSVEVARQFVSQLKTNKVAPENVSYRSTFNMIKGIFEGSL